MGSTRKQNGVTSIASSNRESNMKWKYLSNLFFTWSLDSPPLSLSLSLSTYLICTLFRSLSNLLRKMPTVKDADLYQNEYVITKLFPLPD